ncbi:MAG: helix-turn-helix transcriptional regulator [Bacteroidetes bacterium]|nr:helix-turn-helix transcriptional regulator [Bacteroidota bacterium]MCW5895015.1 helix-turn-helix transcriptional regulator [Bacteroidota bacterium]
MVKRKSGQFSQIRLAIAHIKSHWQEGKSLKEIAATYRVDPGNLARAFRVQESMTEKKFVDMKRAEYIRQKLSKNHVLGYELADELGFASDFAFYRWVRRVFEIPFTVLRKQATDARHSR